VDEDSSVVTLNSVTAVAVHDDHGHSLADDDDRPPVIDDEVALTTGTVQSATSDVTAAAVVVAAVVAVSLVVVDAEKPGNDVIANRMSNVDGDCAVDILQTSCYGVINLRHHSNDKRNRSCCQNMVYRPL